METLNSIRNVLTIVIIMGPSKGSWHKPLMGCLKLTTPSSSPHPTGRRGQRWSLQSHLLTIPPTVPPGREKSSWRIFPSSPRVLPRLLPRGGPPPSQSTQLLSHTSRQGSAFTIKLEAPSLGPRGPCIRPDSLSLLKSGDSGHPCSCLRPLGMVPIGQCLTNSFMSPCSSQGCRRKVPVY